MARAAEGEWERGTIGQDVCLLLECDPNIRDVLEEAVINAPSRSEIFTFATSVHSASHGGMSLDGRA